MKRIQLVSVFLCFSVGALSPAPGQETPPPTEAATIAFVERNAKALATITDRDSAEKATSELEAWRNSPFVSSDSRTITALEALIEESASLREALDLNSEQMKRINGIDPDLRKFVIEAMTGSPPLDLVNQFTALAERLEGVTDMASLQQAAPDLEALGSPLFPSAEHGVDDLQVALKHQEDLEADVRTAIERFLKEIARIDQLGPELRLEVRRVISRPHVLAMEENAKRLPELRTRADAHALKVAIMSFYTEYRRFPFAPNDEDSSQPVDAKLVLTLAGKNKVTNPRMITFLQMKLPDDLSDWVLLDDWGNPMRLFIDTDYNQRLVIPRKGEDETIIESVAVESAGPDGDFDTVEDNVNSWEKVPQ